MKAIGNKKPTQLQAIGDISAKILTSVDDASKKLEQYDVASRDLTALYRDLETTIIFANAGSFNATNNGSFSGTWIDYWIDYW